MKTRTLATWLFVFGAACLLCWGQAGDVFNTNTRGSACDQARNAEDATYSANIQALVDKYNASESQPGPPDLERLRQYARERGDEDTRHAKAMSALDAEVCSYLRETGTSACDQATYREDKTYEQNMSKLEQRRLDEDNQANDQRLNCGSDSACVARVNAQALKVLQAWAAAREQEAERHLKALEQIKSGDCAVHGSATTSSGSLQGSAQASGDNLRPNQKPNQSQPIQSATGGQSSQKQTNQVPAPQGSASPCYTPGRDANCSAVRFGWGDCPGTKQACGWCYGPDGVFAYVPRGSVYTLSSPCNDFPKGTIWATKSAQTALQMTKAGGDCTPNGSGGYICSNVDPNRFKEASGQR